MSEHKFFAVASRFLTGHLRVLSVFLVLLATVLVTNSPARSEYIEWIYLRQNELEYIYKGYTFPPKEEVTDGFWGSEYRKARARGECSRAPAFFIDSFEENFPDVATNIAENMSGKITAAWIYLIFPKFYPEVLFCATMQPMDTLLKQIEAQKLPFDLFTQKRDLYSAKSYDDPTRRLRRHIENLFILALANYPQAQMALATLSDRGQHLRLTPAFAYVALARARASGYTENRLEYLYRQARCPERKSAACPGTDHHQW